MAWMDLLLGQVRDGPINAAYAYVVPSRALITQVSRQLMRLLVEAGIASRPRVISMPSQYSPSESRPTVMVFTQERLERLLRFDEQLELRVLIVDEAQKLGDGARGVILQRVIDEAKSRGADCRIVLASPHIANPEILLPTEQSEADVSLSSITDARPSVIQNLIWVNPVPRRRSRWMLTLITGEAVVDVGELTLPSPVTGKKRQLAALANTLGAHSGGNIVFANGPAEAEEIALTLAGYLEQSGIKPDREVLELAALVREQVHPAFPLATTLRSGVGVHYGDMPEIARREQERLFSENKLLYMICTATLLEGVNLPCSNLFIWGPRQGPGKPMSEHAFWNLAGRAGRWGQEFAGSIFCIDVHDETQWPNGPPRRRAPHRATSSGHDLLAQFDGFLEFVESPQPGEAVKDARYFEQSLGEFVAARILGRALSSSGLLRSASHAQVQRLEDLADRVVSQLQAPTSVVARHRGISPILVDNLYRYLTSLSPDRAESMMPMAPDMPNAARVLESNMAATDMFLGSEFGTQQQRVLKANLTVDWIRGRSLGAIVRQRVEYRLSRGARSVPAEIRSVLSLIEENARYAVPKYLACYADVVASWLRKIGRMDLFEEIGDVQDLLEAGVSERSMLALIGLGLSRTSAVGLSQLLPRADLSLAEVLDWIEGRDLSPYGLSPVIQREVDAAIAVSMFA